MTIQQANQYFAALPDGFADPEQLGALLPASVQRGFAKAVCGGSKLCRLHGQLLMGGKGIGGAAQQYLVHRLRGCIIT